MPKPLLQRYPTQQQQPRSPQGLQASKERMRNAGIFGRELYTPPKVASPRPRSISSHCESGTPVFWRRSLDAITLFLRGKAAMAWDFVATQSQNFSVLAVYGVPRLCRSRFFQCL